MATKPNKHVSKAEYHLVYSELIVAARYRGTVTYQEIAQILGLPLSGENMGKQVGSLVGAISEAEVIQGRPMLSAVVVRKGSFGPGPSFYILAGQLGLFAGNSPEERRRFWEAERRKVYKTWQKRLK